MSTVSNVVTAWARSDTAALDDDDTISGVTFAVMAQVQRISRAHGETGPGRAHCNNVVQTWFSIRGTASCVCATVAERIGGVLVIRSSLAISLGSFVPCLTPGARLRLWKHSV